MEFKDYYATLGVSRSAKPEENVSKEPDAEARFKEVAEAYEALSDTERRAAYDDIGQGHDAGQAFTPPPGWNSGFEFSGQGGDDADHSAFFEALFGRAAGSGRAARAARPATGGDHHAKVQIDLQDAYRGGRRTITMHAPQRDADGRTTMRERHLDVNIPKGVRSGQQLRLAGQGGAGQGGGPAGDLYLEIEFAPHPHFRVDGRDVYVDLPVAPWEAALGASVTVPTPDGSVELTVPAGSQAGRRMRLKGQGLPSTPAGDLYVMLAVALPAADSAAAQDAYRALAAAFTGFDPRRPPTA